MDEQYRLDAEEEISDDHFTWWHDELSAQPGSERNR